MRKVALGLLLLLSLNALAQDPDEHNRYLLPVIGRDLPGANGSIWSTEWTVHNFLDRPFDLIWNACHPTVNPCPGPTIHTRLTVRPLIFPRGDGTDGAFIYVPKDADARVGMSLRVRDLSKNATSFGTEIPIVSVEKDYSSTARPELFLVDVPTEAKYRATLRLYGVSEAPQSVVVTVFPESSGTPVEQYRVDLSGIIHVVPEPFPLHPAYAQLDPLTPAVRAAGARVHISIRTELPNNGGIVPAWGFVTITDNETQQVTTVTPQR